MNKKYILLLIVSTASLVCMEKKTSSDLEIPLLQKTNELSPSQQSFEHSLAYNDGCNLIERLKKEFNTHALLLFVTKFKTTKNNGIHEDKLVRNAWGYNDIRLAMFFSYIKGYTQKKEALPTLDNLIIKKQITKINDPLADYFGIESPDNTIITECTYNENTKHTHPAFNLLRHNVIQILTRPGLVQSFKDLFNYIYRYTTRKPQSFPSSYDKLKELFDNEAHKMFQGCKADIHMLLHIIELGKQLNPQKQESDFGRDIAAIPLTMSEQFGVTVWDQKKPIFDKQRIAILCKAIETYNTQRCSKLSPTHEQKQAYNAYFLDPIVLPDTFNSELLNKKIYAFDELERLLDMIQLIKDYSSKKVETCFKTLYSQNV